MTERQVIYSRMVNVCCYKQFEKGDERKNNSKVSSISKDSNKKYTKSLYLYDSYNGNIEYKNSFLTQRKFIYILNSKNLPNIKR